MPFIDRISEQFGYLGVASFLGSYLILNKDSGITVANLISCLCLSLVIMLIFYVIRPSLVSNVFKAASENIIPSVGLLNQKDSKAFNDVTEKKYSVTSAISIIFVSSMGNILLNIIASILYTRYM